VLRAMRMDEERLEGALRMSWWHLSAEPDWGEVARRLGEVKPGNESEEIRPMP